MLCLNTWYLIFTVSVEEWPAITIPFMGEFLSELLQWCVSKYTCSGKPKFTLLNISIVLAQMPSSSKPQFVLASTVKKAPSTLPPALNFSVITKVAVPSMALMPAKIITKLMAQMPPTSVPQCLALMPPTIGTRMLAIMPQLDGGGDYSSDEAKDDIPFANTDSNEAETEYVGFANSSSDFENNESDLVAFKLPTLVYSSNADERSKSFDKSLLKKSTDGVCSSTCTKFCSESVSKMSGIDIENIKTNFVGSKKSNTKANLLSHLIFQERAGIPVKGVFVNNTMFCKNYFSYLSGISKYIVNSVFKDYHQGVKRYIHGNSHRYKESVACVNFISWMKVFSQNFGQDAPDDIATILPAFLYKERPNRIFQQTINFF